MFFGVLPIVHECFRVVSFGKYREQRKRKTDYHNVNSTFTWNTIMPTTLAGSAPFLSSNRGTAPIHIGQYHTNALFAWLTVDVCFHMFIVVLIS